MAYEFLSNNNCDIFYLDARNIDGKSKRVNKYIELCGYEYNAHAYIINSVIAKQLIDSGIKENLISPDEFLTYTFCDHPRKDLSEVYSIKKLKAYKLSHQDYGEEYYIRQSIAHIPGQISMSELESSEEI